MIQEPELPSEPELGLPGYLMVRQLGSGGTGTVMLARAEETDELVAVKFLSPLLSSSSEFVDRFREEAAILQRLRHPNIVSLLEFVEGPERDVIIMAVVDGVPLRQVLAVGPTSPEVALLVLRGSLRGLDRAHRASVIHRNYKPENVLVDWSGTSRLVDFGLAVPVALSGLGLTGSPAYMAPEQWVGEPVTPATDVYAASMVLFECLTGRPPFADVEGKVAIEVAHREAPVPVDEVPEPLRDLIAQGAAKAPADRFADAGAFLVALERAASHGYGAAWASRGAGALVAAVVGSAELFPLAGSAAATAVTVTPAAAPPPPAVLVGSRAALSLAVLAASIGITGGVLVGVHRDKGSQPPTANLAIGRSNGAGGSGSTTGLSGVTGTAGADGATSILPVVAVSSPGASGTGGTSGASLAGLGSGGLLGLGAPGGAAGPGSVIVLPGARATAVQLGLGGGAVADRPTPVSITVSAPGGTAPTTGTVTVSVDGKTALTSLPVSNGQATGTMTFPTSGSHVVVADYSGAAEYLPATNKLSVNAAPAATTVALVPSAARATFGQPVTFDAQVKPGESGGQAPGGMVEFTDGNGALGQPVPVDGAGHAQLSVSSLAGGVHSVTAHYRGDQTFAGTASSPVQTTIDPLATQLRSAAGAKLSSLTVQMSAVLTGADGSALAGRTVAFSMVGGQQCTAVTGADGRASCSVGILGLGLTSLVSFTARFAGDNNFAASSAKGGLL